MIALLAPAGPIAAVFTPDQDPTGVLTMLAPVLFGTIIPLLVARYTKAEARARLKIGVSAGLAVLIGAVTALGLDWGDTSSIPIVLNRVAAVLGSAQVTYLAVDAALERYTGTDLNSQAWVRPERGID